MKKLLFYFCLVTAFNAIFLPIPTANYTSDGARVDVKYAQIKQTTNLCQKLDGEFVTITSLPATYFVIVLSDSDQGYYKVSYLDLDGYVNEQNIELVDYEPLYKFATGKIKINNPEIGSVNLRSSPDHNNDDNIIDEITKSNNSISYYGIREGSQIGSESKWYYIKAKLDDEFVHGYVYGANMLSDPILDNEIVKVPPPTADDENTPTLNPMSDNMVYVFVAILCAPIILIMFLLFKKKSPVQKT